MLSPEIEAQQGHHHEGQPPAGRQPPRPGHHPDLPVEEVRLADVSVLHHVGLDDHEGGERRHELVLERQQQRALQVVADDGLGRGRDLAIVLRITGQTCIASD